MKEQAPIVTIVGRQNVGKSTLFNALIKEKKAIVDSHPGLTRDILSYTVSHKSCTFILSDTPGLDIKDSTELSRSILENAKVYLGRSSLIILLLENPTPAPFDFQLMDIVRKLSLPIITVVNKMDNPDDLENMLNFYETGFNDIIPISALGRFNLQLLLDKIYDLLPVKKGPIADPDCRIAIVGRPNSGKSTLLNAFLGYTRALVSEIPGTTRDAVDDEFYYHKKKIQVIDTAGVRKKTKVKEAIEYYSMTRTAAAIHRSDVSIHLVDACAGLTELDIKISDEIQKAKKPIIIALNKWDAVPKNTKTLKEYTDLLTFKFYKAVDFPIIAISAKEKQRLHRIIDTALDLKERASRKIETVMLNKLLAKLQNSQRLPQFGETIKIYYATQTGTAPPKFTFFVNNPKYFRADVLRYFEKTFQREFDLAGIPIVFHLEGKKRKR
jgi:GTP-binding protein